MQRPNHLASPPRIVVLGAGYAGLLAAVRAKKRLRERARVVLVNARPTFAERIRAHEAAASGRAVEHHLGRFLRGTGVELHVGRVRSLALGAREVALEDGTTLPYDHLVCALGSRSDPAPLRALARGPDAPPVFCLEPGGDDGAEALRARLASLRAGDGAAPRLDVLVVGGGLTGIEGAAELAASSEALRVTLASGGALAPMLSARGRVHVHEALTRLGVTVWTEARVQALEGGAAVLHDGRRVRADVVVACTGFTVPALLREAGLACNDAGQARVDGTLRALGHPEVLAVGDCAAIEAPLFAPLSMSCKTGMPTGAHAGDVLAALVRGTPVPPLRFADSIYCVSLGREDGLVEWLRPDGRPRGRVVRGRLGAWLKELVCRYTWLMLRAERHRGLGYLWPRRAALAPPPAERKELRA